MDRFLEVGIGRSAGIVCHAVIYHPTQRLIRGHTVGVIGRAVDPADAVYHHAAKAVGRGAHQLLRQFGAVGDAKGVVGRVTKRIHDGAHIAGALGRVIQRQVDAGGHGFRQAFAKRVILAEHLVLVRLGELDEVLCELGVTGDGSVRDARSALIEQNDVAPVAKEIEEAGIHRNVLHGVPARATVQIDHRIRRRRRRAGLQEGKRERKRLAACGVMVLGHRDPSADDCPALDLQRAERARAGLDRNRITVIVPAGVQWIEE